MAEKGAELGVPAVLAMLLINRNRPVATDALIGAAWERFPPPDPRASRVQHPQAAGPYRRRLP
jgi:DNA-binding SARP family transcriptional activator